MTTMTLTEVSPRCTERAASEVGSTSTLHAKSAPAFCANADDLLSSLAETPATIGLVLAVNMSHQVKVQRFKECINDNIQKVRLKRLAISMLQASKAEDRIADLARQCRKVPTIAFVPPYFKDKRGGVPKQNAESKDIADAIGYTDGYTAVHNTLVLPPKKWNHMEAERLTRGVHESLLESRVKPLLEKRAVLKKRMKTPRAGQDDKYSSLMIELEVIDSRIRKYRGMPLYQLCQQANSGIDWMRVSSCSFSGFRTPFECKIAWDFIYHPSSNCNKKWTKREDINLEQQVKRRRIMESGSGSLWQVVANSLGTLRSAFHTYEHYQSLVNRSLHHTAVWSVEEDALMEEVIAHVKDGDAIPFDQVAFYMEGRTPRACKLRWNSKVGPATKRGRFTEEEDLLVSAAVHKYGIRDWKSIVKEVPGRTETQCRERWYNSLDNNIRTDLWTDDEDTRLLQGFEMFGAGHWAKISAYVMRRTPGSCKTRFKILSRNSYQKTTSSHMKTVAERIVRNTLKTSERRNQLNRKLAEKDNTIVNGDATPSTSFDVSASSVECDPPTVYEESHYPAILPVLDSNLRDLAQEQLGNTDVRQPATSTLDEVILDVLDQMCGEERRTSTHSPKTARGKKRRTETSVVDDMLVRGVAKVARFDDDIPRRDYLMSDISKRLMQRRSRLDLFPPNVATLAAFERLLHQRAALRTNAMLIGDKTDACSSVQEARERITHLAQVRNNDILAEAASRLSGTGGRSGLTRAEFRHLQTIAALCVKNEQEETDKLKVDSVSTSDSTSSASWRSQIGNASDFLIFRRRLAALFSWPALLSVKDDAQPLAGFEPDFSGETIDYDEGMETVIDVTRDILPEKKARRVHRKKVPVRTE